MKNIKLNSSDLFQQNDLNYQDTHEPKYRCFNSVNIEYKYFKHSCVVYPLASE